MKNDRIRVMRVKAALALLTACQVEAAAPPLATGESCLRAVGIEAKSSKQAVHLASAWLARPASGLILARDCGFK